MKILYISYDGMTDHLGQSQVIPYLLGLASKEIEITLISCEKKSKFNSFATNIEQILKSGKINWIPVKYSSLPSVLSKKLNLTRIKKKAIDFCKNNKPDIVHCRSYMASLIGLELKKKFKVKFIFDMRGFWADERIDGKIWDKTNWIHRKIYTYFKKKEIEFLTQADYTISLTENAKNEIHSWPIFKNNLPPIEVIPCCVDMELFSIKNISVEKQNELRKRFNIQNDFIISYLGSIGTWYMLDEMLDFFKCLLSEKPNAKFLFITSEDPSTIISSGEKKQINKDRFIILSAKRQEVPLYLSLSDVSIYFIKPLYSKKASSPTKTGEIMALGIPIITNTGIGDSDKILTDSGAGFLINEFTEKEYLNAISNLDELTQKDKMKIRTSAEKFFSLEKGIELYYSVYKKVISKK